MDGETCDSRCSKQQGQSKVAETEQKWNENKTGVGKAKMTVQIHMEASSL